MVSSQYSLKLDGTEVWVDYSEFVSYAMQRWKINDISSLDVHDWKLQENHTLMHVSLTLRSLMGYLRQIC